jgi:signal recognition particle subunit SEC65
MPSSQITYMKQLVAGGVEAILPPSKEELKSWKAIYLCYFNSELSVKEGRRLPKKLCVRNPRPDEVLQALTQIGLKSVFEQVSGSG